MFMFMFGQTPQDVYLYLFAGLEGLVSTLLIGIGWYGIASPCLKPRA